MKVRTFSSSSEAHGFGEFRWQMAYHGAEIDARTKAAIGFVQGAASKSFATEFLAEQPDRLQINGQWALPSSLRQQMSGKTQIVLEATSLGMVEVLLLLRAAKAAGVSMVDCVYVEPKEYTKDVYLDTSWSREFSLSRSRRLEGVRGFAHKLSEISGPDAKLVVFLGYEASRLAQACQQEDAIAGWRKYAVFGVPGYSPGWEMNAMANNVDALERNKFESVQYCAASSVSSAYELLTTIHNEGRTDNSCTVVAPFGTKPHGIASAMFLIENTAFQASSLMYDHPARSPDRSTDVRRWHLYRIHIAHNST